MHNIARPARDTEMLDAYASRFSNQGSYVATHAWNKVHLKSWAESSAYMWVLFRPDLLNVLLLEPGGSKFSKFDHVIGASLHATVPQYLFKLNLIGRVAWCNASPKVLCHEHIANTANTTNTANTDSNTANAANTANTDSNSANTTNTTNTANTAGSKEQAKQCKHQHSSLWKYLHDWIHTRYHTCREQHAQPWSTTPSYHPRLPLKSTVLASSGIISLYLQR